MKIDEIIKYLRRFSVMNREHRVLLAIAKMTSKTTWYVHTEYIDPHAQVIVLITVEEYQTSHIKYAFNYVNIRLIFILICF